MRPWQRNRIAVVLLIFFIVVIMNLSQLNMGQKGSLLALGGLLTFLYIVYGNRYKKK